MERVSVESTCCSEGSLSVLRQKRKKARLLLFTLFAALLLVMVLAIRCGAVDIPFSAMFLGDGSVSYNILLRLRLPRVILAALAGASLAVAGATFQALFRNPMADPYIIGVSSGASLGAVLAIVLSLSFSFLGVGAIPLLAFAAAMMTALMVFNLAKVGDTVSPLTLLLAGIAAGSFLSAIVSLLTYFAGEKLHQVIFWLMGGFSGATWAGIRLAFPYFLLGTTVIYLHARFLNCMLLGEETATHLGIEVERVKKTLLAAASLLTAIAVATSGLIGFVGLIVPHVIRLLVGPDHRTLVPASALGGAILMVTADAVARTVLAPTELPVGLVTALGGAPFFIYLLRNRKKIKHFI